MRTLIFLLLPFLSFAQLPTTGSLSLKSAAGAGRSISQQVDGNETGNKSLSTLSTSAGFDAPHSMLEFRGYPPSTPPNALLSCAATNDNPNGIDFTWTLATSGPGAEVIVIDILSGTTANGWFQSIVNNPGSGAFTVGDANFIDGNAYTFTVSPCNDSDNDGSLDDCATPCTTGSVSYDPPAGPPDAPTGFSATSDRPNGILLEWDAQADASSFTLWRSVNGESFNFLDDGVISNSYRDNNSLILGAGYQYQIRAEGPGGFSSVVTSNGVNY